MRRIRFAVAALADLREGLGYIAEENPNAADRIADAIEKRLRQLKRVPRAGRVVPELADPERREVLVHPFRIVYRLVENDIRVVAVVQVKRDFEAALPAETGPGDVPDVTGARIPAAAYRGRRKRKREAPSGR